MHTQRGQQWLTISNMLSLVRLLLAPVVVWALGYHHLMIAFIVFLVASITDFFDGYLARKFKEQTIVGQYLDPLADKALVVASFSALAYVHLVSLSLPTWFLWLVVCRECIILCGGLGIFLWYPHIILKPSWLGKITAAAYMCLILWIFLCHFLSWLPRKTFSGIVYLVALLSIASLIHYCYRCYSSIAVSHKSS